MMIQKEMANMSVGSHSSHKKNKKGQQKHPSGIKKSSMDELVEGARLYSAVGCFRNSQYASRRIFKKLFI